MLLCPGQKLLYAPPVPMEPQTGEGINQQIPRNLEYGLIPNKMENHSCLQQFPIWNLGKDSKQTEN